MCTFQREVGLPVMVECRFFPVDTGVTAVASFPLLATVCIVFLMAGEAGDRCLRELSVIAMTAVTS